MTLDCIVDSIERLILQRDPATAFELLAALFHRDAVVMETCGDNDWEVTCAYERAARVMAVAGAHLPDIAVEESIRHLLGADSYGVRASLVSVRNPEATGD